MYRATHKTKCEACAPATVTMSVNEEIDPIDRFFSLVLGPGESKTFSLSECDLRITTVAIDLNAISSKKDSSAAQLTCSTAIREEEVIAAVLTKSAPMVTCDVSFFHTDGSVTFKNPGSLALHLTGESVALHAI